MRILQAHADWPIIKSICSRLNQAGFEAVLAGGCVRDALLGISPKDFDVATSAKPEEVEKVFERVLEVGKSFGVCVVVEQGLSVEIATFRKDGIYKDGRHPESISYSSKQEDALRRDFTVNALFYDPVSGEVLDFVKGRDDLQAKLIRAVGDPELRFAEDKLRILRAIRFVSQLGFKLDEGTWNACLKMRSQLHLISLERIRVELEKTLEGKHVQSALPLLKEFLPEISPVLAKASAKDFAEFQSMGSFAANLTRLLWSVWREEGQNWSGLQIELRRLRLSNQDRDDIHFYLTNLEALIDSKKIDLVSQLKVLVDPRFAELERLLFVLSTQAKVIVDKLNELRVRFLPDGKMPKPLLNGNSLQSLGLVGPKLGEALHNAYEYQIENSINNSNELLDWVSKCYRYHKPQ